MSIQSLELRGGFFHQFSFMLQISSCCCPAAVCTCAMSPAVLHMHALPHQPSSPSFSSSSRPSSSPVGLSDPLVPHGCCSTGTGHVGAWQEGHYVGEYACSQLRGLKARVLITAEQSIINPALEYQIPVRLGHCLGILKSSETEIISFRMTHCQIKHFSYYPFLPLSLSCSLSWII